MKQLFHTVLRFFNLLDRSKNLSITNIAIIVLITKMALTPFDWPTAAGLLVVMFNYMHKRAETNKVMETEFEVAKFDEILTNVNQFQERLNKFQLDHDKVAKQAQETKNLLTSHNLSHTFGATRRHKADPT